MAIEFSLSHHHPLLGLIFTAFVGLLLVLRMTFIVLHMVSIGPLIPVKTVFKSLVSCSEFIIVLKQFYSHSSLHRGREHSSLELCACVYIFVDCIHSRLLQLEKKHGYAEKDVTSLNVRGFRHVLVAD